MDLNKKFNQRNLGSYFLATDVARSWQAALYEASMPSNSTKSDSAKKAFFSTSSLWILVPYKNVKQSDIHLSDASAVLQLPKVV